MVSKLDAIQVHHDKIEARVRNQAREVAEVSNVPVLVVDVVPVNGSEAGDQLRGAGQERHLHQKILGQTPEDKSVKNEDANDVQKVEEEKSAMSNHVEIVAEDGPIGRFLLVIFAKKVKNRIRGGGVGHCIQVTNGGVVGRIYSSKGWHCVEQHVACTCTWFARVCKVFIIMARHKTVLSNLVIASHVCSCRGVSFRDSRFLTVYWYDASTKGRN